MQQPGWISTTATTNTTDPATANNLSTQRLQQRLSPNQHTDYAWLYTLCMQMSQFTAIYKRHPV